MAALLASAACAPGPDAVLPDVLRAVEAHDAEALAALVDDGYADPLGREAELLRDVTALGERFGRISVKASDVSFSPGATKLVVHATGRVDVELVSDTTWRATGPLSIELVKDGRFRARTGVLDDVRGVVALMDGRRAALEANDVEGYVALLHPSYRDGDTVDRDAVRERLARDLEGVRIRMAPSLYKLEVRGDRAHVDEHYVLSVNGRELAPAIARLTLLRAAGRWRIARGLYPSSD